MPSSTDSWGIEVGAYAVKTMHLKQDGDDIKVEAFDVIPHANVLTAPDTDIDETIRVTLDQVLARHTIKKSSSVIVSVPGHAAFARFAKLPPVEPKQIPDIVKYEAVQQIPFPLEQVEWDYQTFADPDSPDVEAGIFAITKERLTPWLYNFKQADIPVHGVMLSPIAVFNALNFDLNLASFPDGTVLMDIGTQSTDLIITENGRVWLRTIPIGGNRFTEALVRSFKLSHAKAEKLKKEATTSKYARQIFQAMRPVFVDLVQAVQQSLGYYQSLNRDTELARLIGIGSTFRLPGLQTFLKQQLQLDVKRLDQFTKLEVDGKQTAAFSDQAITLAPAYGLALQGLQLESVSCNLLPREMLNKLAWKARQPWFLGAAAAVLVGVGASYVLAGRHDKAYNAAASQTARNATQTAYDNANRHANDWDAITQGQENPQQRFNNLFLSIRDQNIFARINADITAATKALDPNNLLDGDIDQIPRNQRPQIFLSSLTITPEPAPGFLRGTNPDEYAQQDPAAAGLWQNYQPSYLIQLEGYTAHQQRDQFLEKHFLEHIRENADIPTNPYTISGIEITRLETFVPDPSKDNNLNNPQDVLLEQFRPQLTQQMPLPGDTEFLISWRIILRDPDRVPGANENNPE